MPGRTIADNVALVRDVLALSGQLGIDTGLIFLDQEKAFDRVEHQYLWKALEAFQFNHGFIAKVRVLYQNIESVLKVNGGLSAPFKACRGIRQGCALSGMLYSLAIEPLLHRIRTAITGFKIPGCPAFVKLSAYADDLAVMISGQKDVDVLTTMVNDFKVLSSAKINWSKSEALLVGGWRGGQPTLPGELQWTCGGIKYLGIFLGDDDMVKKNWEGVLEMVEGRLRKWKWLLPQMSYRGRTLVINNLVASALWHRLACVDPPSGLLAKVQSVLVEFFWDRLHWVPQNVLYMPKEEGGQGLVHLGSRGAAFRLQFIQRLLYGPANLVWRPLACAILQRAGGLGLDASIFLMDYKGPTLSGLPVFYNGLLRAWSFLKRCRAGSATSTFWLLEEPLVYGSRLDVCCEALPQLTELLCASKTVKLRQAVGTAGRELDQVGDFGTRLRVRSGRYTSKVLLGWRQALTDVERQLLRDCGPNLGQHNTGDPFPRLLVSPRFSAHQGSLLEHRSMDNVALDVAHGKTLYNMVVKVVHEKKLISLTDTPWRSYLGLMEEEKPQWRALYKPPLAKRVGDLQWRVLHGIIAVNSFISVMNPAVSHHCPFCIERETVFHCFSVCVRLRPLFAFLGRLFRSMGETFSKKVFILGFPYSCRQRAKSQLINFVLGQAKMAIYLSRKTMVERGDAQDTVAMVRGMIKARVMVEFRYYKAMRTLEVFKSVWGHRGAVCSVEEGELLFAEGIG